MVSRCTTVSFQGIRAVSVDVQVMIGPGKMMMQIVGLADKAVTESRERVQAALHASGLSMPNKRVTVNLAPADLPKEGSHYDLPIALALMCALGAMLSDPARLLPDESVCQGAWPPGGLSISARPGHAVWLESPSCSARPGNRTSNTVPGPVWGSRTRICPFMRRTRVRTI